MAQHKAQLTKQQKRGVDFKRIKRKIGRKLPPPKNTTNTQVKSKVIVLPEQSLASEKGGLAVSKKGLTLKELLQQTSHHNAKVRRDALLGIRDIFVKHPTELKLHRLSVIEKLRERMSDEDKMVRETLYQLLKAVVFPGCNEDNQGTFISLMMAFVFNAMTHLSIDVRLMAFKFFDLVVQHYPLSFSMYAEKIIQHYKDILQKNEFNLHDKGKLKSVLAGLAYCLSLLPSHNNSSTENDPRFLHAFESELHQHHSAGAGLGRFLVTAKELKGLLPILVGGIQDFMPSLKAQSYDCVLSILKSIHLIFKFLVCGKEKSGQQLEAYNTRDEEMLQILLKKLFDVFPLNPTHHSSEKGDNRYFVLNIIVAEIFFLVSAPSAFLEKFLLFVVDALSHKACSNGKAFFQKHSLPLIPFIPKLMMQVDDTWKSHILQAFTEVFKNCDPESSMKLVCLSAIEEMIFPKESWVWSSSEMVEFGISWIREIPELLRLLGDKNPSSSKAVLRLQHLLGQRGLMKQEVDKMQYSLRHFYSTCNDGGDITYGPFMKLPREIQEVSISCLYYFSFLDSSLLQSLAACCLCEDVDAFVLFRLLEVVSCAYRAGHVPIADYISFLITLISRYPPLPESSSKCRLFRGATSAVCSCLTQIGDHHLVFKMVEGAVIHQISNKAGLENTCALLRMIVTLDSKPTRLSQHTTSKLANVFPGYLMDVVSQRGVGEEDSDGMRRYYILPCLLLFNRSESILKNVLEAMTCLISDESSSSRIINALLVLAHEDVRVLLSCKQHIHNILQSILTLISDEGCKLNMEQKHKIQCAHDQLNTIFTRSIESSTAMC